MRRIKHASVKRLALCKRGKTGLRTLYKSDGTAEYATLVKGDVEKGSLLAVMWPKGLADEDGDFADTDRALESMSSSLIANGGQLDIEHDGKVLPPEAARITEVFTIQKSDERFQGWEDYDGKVADVTGGIAVAIQIDDPDLRAAYRDGEWDGVSMFGPAAVEQVDTLAASQRVAARMGGVQENDMTPDELKAVLAAQDANVATLVKSAVTEALDAAKAEEKAAEEKKAEEKKAEAKPEAVAPTFTGDVTDPEALGAYESSLRNFEMQKSIASGKITADDIAEMRKSLTENTSELATEAGVEAEDSDEVRGLKVKLFKAQKASNAPERSGKSDKEADLVKAQEIEALEIAKLMNANMGNAGESPSTMRVINA